MLVFFGVRCFNALNVLFHSNPFIQRCPSITLWRNNVAHSLPKNYFPALAFIFVGLVESRGTPENEPGTFRVWIFLKGRGIPLSFNNEVRQLARFAVHTFDAPC